MMDSTLTITIESLINKLKSSYPNDEDVSIFIDNVNIILDTLINQSERNSKLYYELKMMLNYVDSQMKKDLMKQVLEYISKL